MLSCEYCETFKNTYFEEHLWTAASRLVAAFLNLLYVAVSFTYMSCFVSFQTSYFWLAIEKRLNCSSDGMYQFFNWNYIVLVSLVEEAIKSPRSSISYIAFSFEREKSAERGVYSFFFQSCINRWLVPSTGSEYMIKIWRRRRVWK